MQRPIAAGALVLLNVAWLSCPRAQPADDEIRKTVQFSLQCNATIGLVDHVAVSEKVRSTDGASVTVRGTYRQSIPAFNAFSVRSPDSGGGVFEAVYAAGSSKMESLQFKISLRSGKIDPNCLR